MTQGITGTYAINGTNLLLQPTSGRWLERQILGLDGAGHPVYPAVREFELGWNLMTPADANQLQGFFNSIQNTGTCVVDLPQYSAATYTFFSYTGCIVHEPNWSTYFAEHQSDCTLLITNIRT